MSVKIVKNLVKNNFTAEISFHGTNCITYYEVDQMIRLYKELTVELKQISKPNIQIKVFVDNLIYFDMAFIAVLNLMSTAYNAIDIYLVYETTETTAEVDKCYYQLGHFMTSSLMFSSRPLFKIIKNGKIITPKRDKFALFLTSSRNYLPIIQINPKTYEDNFTINFYHVWKEVFIDKFEFNSFNIFYNETSPSKTVNQRLYATYKKYILSKVSKSYNNSNSIYRFSQYFMYCINALATLGTLKLLVSHHSSKIRDQKLKAYLEGNTSLGIGKFTRENDEYYLTEVNKRILWLLSKPSFYVLQTSFLISNLFDKENITLTSPDSLLDVIDSVLHFSMQLYDGVKELAKNIVEHSTTREGAITARIYNLENLRSTKPKSFHKYLEQHQRYVDIVIMDNGSSGVINETKKKLLQMMDSFKATPEELLIKEEIKKLESGDLKFRNFFETDSIALFHQQVRSAASLGLLIFSDFIKRNDGLMHVSTHHDGSAIGVLLNPSGLSDYIDHLMMPMGTCYNLLVPIVLNKLAVRASSIPYEMMASADAFRELSKFKFVKVKQSENCGIKENLKAKCITCVDISIDDIKNKQFEYIECIDNCNKRNRMVLGLRVTTNFNEVDACNLFRYLADIQIKYGWKAIVVYNIDEETVQRMINIINIYQNIKQVAWSNSNYILFYYKKTTGLSDYPIYYYWLLAGESHNDMIWINDLILKNNLGEPIWKEDAAVYNPSKAFMEAYKHNPLFSGHGHLLPFDLLLDIDDLSLFHRNILSISNEVI